MRRRWLSMICGAVLGVAACDGDTNTPDAGLLPLIPVAVGNTWSYKVTEADGSTKNKTQTITEMASSGSNMGYRFVTSRGATRETQSVQALVDNVLLRYEETGYKDNQVEERIRYAPAMVRTDGKHQTAGETYQTEHLKLTLNALGAVTATVAVQNRFEVEATADQVDVPAGRFTALRVRRVDLSDGSVKTFWYTPGLGKIKEVGGQTEELISVDLAD